MKHTNSLIDSKSPYLLQHAHNPVKWHAWSEGLFERAKNEDKLVLISIGYSSCHWCHVMERECFEDEEVAGLMNERFINIKVDREERPDVDHIYMTAVQLMSGHGGWPLNCFVLPDGRPIYGGTYFPKQKWMELLKNLSNLYQQNKSKVLEYAGELTQGIKQVSEYAVPPEETLFTSEDLANAVIKWKKRFDKQEGGTQGAPKFPMPNNYLFLLRYGVLQADADLLQHVHLTLKKMAQGGIYDQLGGGFARYSTDAEWKVPHFEKMLYDNAQLISLYSEAYRQRENELYKKVVYESIEFIKREMTSAHGGFFSALDADSEGKEGLFYIWTKEELKDVLRDHYDVFADYYSVNAKGYWEDDFYILLRDTPEEDVLANHTLNPEDLQRIIAKCKQKLMERRSGRVRPGLDDKIIASWNGLMVRALCDAYATFGDPAFAALARQNAAFIQKILLQPDGSLFRCAKNNAGYGPAFLDDYAFCLDAFLALFTTFGEAEYLQQAEGLGAYCLGHFYSQEQGLFEYTARGGEALISKNFEVSDNVIPSSNSQMALNLQVLHALTGKSLYEETVQQMLKRMASFIRSSLSSSSNWWLAALRREFAFYEVCVVGKDVDEFMRTFAKHYHPNAIFVYSKQASEAALLKDRYKPGQTLVYVCSQQACQQPVATAQEALEQLK